MPVILLLRHSQASYGAADYDALSDLGREQTAAVAAELRRQGVRLDDVRAGTLRRQQDTAIPIAQAAGVTVRTDARLNEYDTDAVLSRYSTTDARPSSAGGAEVIPSEVFQDLLDDALRRWVAEGGDSWAAFADGVMGALEDAASGLPSGAVRLLVASGGSIGVMCARLLGLPDAAFATFNRVAVNAGLTRVVVGRRGMTLVSYNDHGHLISADRSLVTYR